MKIFNRLKGKFRFILLLLISSVCFGICGLQTIVSRNVNLKNAPAVLTIGKIQGRTRSNIIPEKVEIVGMTRTFDQVMVDKMKDRIRTISTNIHYTP